MNDIPVSLKKLLQENGVEVSGVREINYGTQYQLVQGLDTATLNVYRTGKVSEGGRASELKSLLESWRLSRADSRSGSSGGANGVQSGAAPGLDPTPRLGIDEAGKGDYFGPLVVAGARITGIAAARKLKEAGVRDSKTLGSRRIGEISARILQVLGPENVRVVVLSPEQYEAQREAAGNVNLLLGEVDTRIISELKSQTEKIVVDEFAVAAREYLQPSVPEGVRLEVRSRAEDDAAVAAASILARAKYLEELDVLSEWIGFGLPRGATHVVEAGRRIHDEYGMKGLSKVAKVSFATTKKILAQETLRED